MFEREGLVVRGTTDRVDRLDCGTTDRVDRLDCGTIERVERLGEVIDRVEVELRLRDVELRTRWIADDREDDAGRLDDDEDGLELLP